MSEFKTTPTLIQHLSNVANSTAHNESNSKFSLPTQSKKKRFYVLNCLFRFILALPFRPELCTNTMSLSVSHVVISTIPRCHIFIRRFQRNMISHQMTPTIIINDVLLFVKNMRQNQRYTTQQKFFVWVLSK